MLCIPHKANWNSANSVQEAVVITAVQIYCDCNIGHSFGEAEGALKTSQCSLWKSVFLEAMHVKLNASIKIKS